MLNVCRNLKRPVCPRKLQHLSHFPLLSIFLRTYGMRTHAHTHTHRKHTAFMVWEALIIWVEMSLSSLMTVTAKPFISIYPGYCAKMIPSMQFLLIALFNVKERALPGRKSAFYLSDKLKIYMMRACGETPSGGSGETRGPFLSGTWLVPHLTRVRWWQVRAN